MSVVSSIVCCIMVVCTLASISFILQFALHVDCDELIDMIVSYVGADWLVGAWYWFILSMSAVCSSDDWSRVCSEGWFGRNVVSVYNSSHCSVMSLFMFSFILVNHE